LKIKGIYFLYRLLQAFGLPALLLYFLFRGMRNRGYWKSLPQRFGFLPRSYRQTSPGAIWLHAVSVGEVLSCVELLRRLRREFPHTGIFVSTSTLAGRATADEKLRGLADGVFYAPVDYVFAVRRVLRTLRPSVVAVAETEIWPNLFREVKRTGAGLTLLNGRISDRAFPRYLPFRRLFTAVLPAADSILAQTEPIRERFLALGAPAGRVRTAGNFKYDFEPRAAAPDSPVPAYLSRVRPSAVWIAASTMPPAAAGDVDEDDAVLAAFREIAPRHPGLLLILVPRKPERFDPAAQKLDAAQMHYVRRSALTASSGPADVLLLDTIGELGGLFGSAGVVFMGGTLAQRGGHNILEPALFGKPVIAGPHMENFQAIADDFERAGACVRIADASALAAAVERLLDRPEEAAEIGRRALAAAEAKRGATARAVAEIVELHSAYIPRYRPAMPWFAVAWPLSRLWKWGGAIKAERGLRRARALELPVVAVGNITMGGTGKTPCVLRLAAMLKERGYKPGILTRGYGRGSPEKHLLLPPGAAVCAAHSGDEPQIFVRTALAPVGVGADRFETGSLLARQFDIDIMLLDDGFQHRRLRRDVDVVLIDALNPFAGGELFPLGRLRETLDALARAGIILITRSTYSDLVPAIERRVRALNPSAPIFYATVEPLEWVENRTGARFPVADLRFASPGVFCGIGNPLSFRRTLEGIGVRVVDWVDFADHHHYRPHELRRIAQQMLANGADALVTTEKDAMNLCDTCDDMVAPLPLFWLRVGMRIDRPEAFAGEIEARISPGRKIPYMPGEVQ
jgi:tetraacyldisaccharide 4'-kinase